MVVSAAHAKHTIIWVIRYELYLDINTVTDAYNTHFKNILLPTWTGKQWRSLSILKYSLIIVCATLSKIL